MASALVDEDEGPDGLLALHQRDREHRGNGVALVLGGEWDVRRDVVVPNHPLADEEIADDGAADSVGGVLDIVILVDGGAGQDDVRRFQLVEPEGGDFGDPEIHGLADDDLVQVSEVDRGAEGLGEIVEVGQALDGLEHADGLLLALDRLVERHLRVAQEGLEGGHPLAGLLRQREQELEERHDLALGLQRDGDAGLDRGGEALQERILGGLEVPAIDRGRALIAQEVVDGALVARDGTPEKGFRPFALGGDADEELVGRVRGPDEGAVGGGDPGAPLRGPARRLGQVLAARELSEGLGLRPARGTFGFVGHGCSVARA